MIHRCPCQSEDIFFAEDRNNPKQSNGLFRESNRVLYRCGNHGSISRKGNSTRFYYSDERHRNIAFSKRHYGRRKERKRLQDVESTLQSEKEKDMNGNDKFGDIFIPHPPDTPKSPKNRESISTTDIRSLPTIRGGKLPPLGGKDLDRRIDETQDSHGMGFEPRRSSLKSVEARPEGPNPNSGSRASESESSSEEESVESDSSTVSQAGDREKNNCTSKEDTTDGVTVKNPFKKKKKKKEEQQKVLARQKEFDFETNSGKNNLTLRVEKTDDSDLLKSYENYMREVTTNEDNETSSSGSDGYSVSSLSDEDTDDNGDEERLIDTDFKLKQNNSLLHTKGNLDEALYSLPLKKTDRQQQPAGSDSLKNTLGLSSRLKLMKDTLDNTYMKMDDFKLLRSLSDPNLRRNSLGQIKPLKTHTYLTPVDQDFIAQLYAANNAFGRRPSNSSIDSQEQGLRLRPLPPIPAAKVTKTTQDDPLYETINVCPRCQAREKRGLSLSRDLSTDSATRSKMSFKTVANTLISVMPRLTTQEARSRKMDKALADIKQYLPDHKLRIFLGTWNMKGTKVLPEKLDDLLLPPESVYVQDIYAVGTQEGTPFRREWELRLQETLGPSHVLLHSCNFGVLQLSIFVRREIIWYCTGVEQESVATRMGHQIKTKGALAVAFTVFGTSLLFINSHFTSDEGKLRDRLNDYRSICKSLSLVMGLSKGTQEDDVTAKFDRVFWFGDFNFRVQKSRSDVDKLMAKHTDKKSTIKELLKHDQLLDMLYKGKIFHGFIEHPVQFMPTYKYDVNTDSYDSSTKKRVPSWTDRVLMRSARPDQIEVISYNSCETIKNSDHRPVYCVVEAAIEPIRTKYTVPGGRFDRDLYVEANLRRNAPTGTQGASNVCTIL